MIYAAALLVAYFLPALIAFARNRQPFAIFTLNLFAGWTGIGWLAALIWSVTRSASNV